MDSMLLVQLRMLFGVLCFLAKLPWCLLHTILALFIGLEFPKHTQFTSFCPNSCCVLRRQRRRQCDDREIQAAQVLQIRLADHIPPPRPVRIRLAELLPSSSPPCPHGAPAVSWHSVEALIEAQNFTIANLIRELEYWRHYGWTGPAPCAASDVHMPADASNPAKDASSAVEDSLVDARSLCLDDRLNSFRDEVKLMMHNTARELNQDMKELMLEKDMHFTELIKENTSSLAATTVNSTISLIGKVKKSFDSKLTACLDDVDMRLSALSGSLPQSAAQGPDDSRPFSSPSSLGHADPSSCSSSIPEGPVASDCNAADAPGFSVGDSVTLSGLNSAGSSSVSARRTSADSEATCKPDEHDCSTVPFCSGDFIRLHGLKMAALNGAIGTITAFDPKTQRYAIALHGQGKKAIRAENLMRYDPDDRDACPSCKGYVNLFAFPPCDCVAGTGRSSAACSTDTPSNKFTTEDAELLSTMNAVNWQQ